MPTQSLTLKIRGDIYEPGVVVWAANWLRWQVLGVPPIPRISDLSGGKAFPLDHGYLAEYPNLTADPVDNTGFPSNWENPLDDGQASIIISGPPTYLGAGSGTYEWGVDVTITTPDYFFVGVTVSPFSSEAVTPVYLPAPLYIVCLEWAPTTWAGGGSYIGNIRTFIGGVVEPVFGNTTGSPFFTRFEPPGSDLTGFRLDVSQTVDGDDLSMEVSGATGAIAFYGWQFLDDNEEFIDHPGVPPFGRVIAADYVSGAPWGPYEETGQEIEYQGLGAWVRAVAFDEHGYFGVNEEVKFRPTEPGVRISGVSDGDGVHYAAVKNGNDVEIQEFKDGTASKITKATIANADNAYIYRHKNDSTLYVTARDRSDNGYKLYQSNDLGATFNFMASSPFSTTDYKPPRSCDLADGGHAQAAWKKATTEIWFSRSWDGTNWETPTLAFSLSNLKGFDIYQEGSSNSDVIVIAAINDTGTHLKATSDLGATSPWPDY